MDSVCDDCTDSKRKYDTCFNKWFSERFLNGHTDLHQCDELYKTYQDCLKVKTVSFSDIFPKSPAFKVVFFSVQEMYCGQEN